MDIIAFLRQKATVDWELCPLCGSSSIEGGSVDIEHKWAFQQVTCLNCHATWTEEYAAHSRHNVERGD